MISRSKMAAFGAVAAMALAILPGTSPAQAHTLNTKTVVYGFGGRCPPTNWSGPAVRPARAYFSLACENGVRQIRWRYWRAASAFGHGTILIFNGIGFTRHPGTIYLSTVRKHRGRRYFSHLVMKWITRNGRQHKEVLNWKRDGTFWIWLGNYSGTSAQQGGKGCQGAW